MFESSHGHQLTRYGRNAYTRHLKRRGESHAGSSPATGTIIHPIGWLGRWYLCISREETFGSWLNSTRVIQLMLPAPDGKASPLHGDI